MASSLVALTDISAMNSTCWSSLSWIMESRVKEALWGSNLERGGGGEEAEFLQFSRSKQGLRLEVSEASPETRPDHGCEAS